MPLILLADKTYKFKHSRWGEFSGRIIEKRGDHVTIQVTGGTVTFLGGSMRGPGRRVTMHIANIESAEEA